MLYFADGTFVEVDFFGVADVGVLYVDFVNQTMQSVLAMLSDQSKTSVMIYKNGDEEQRLTGFVVVMGLQNRPSGIIRASMRRQYVGE